MDITNDASLDPFSISPSTIVGRTIAFRVLFCRSMSELRQRLARFLRDAVLPAMSWFHPRNAQGILVMVTLMAFLLRRFTNVKARAESAYRRKFWRSTMRSALTYEEWAHAAKMLDRETLKANESDLYDEELVRNKLAELRRRREEGSLRDVVFYMRADLVRNLGNMCNPELHKGRLQVPKLIKEYIDEVSTQLKMVCNTDSDELMMLEEKLAFMHETRHAFGRTALLLSGGASLGAFHVGVVKTLVTHKLLPRIIAGSSVGSIICAIVATRSWPELQSFFEDSLQSLQFFDKLGGIFQVVKRVMIRGAVHEIRQLQNLLRHLTSNLTFQEAYDMTGRILSVTVCSARKHEPPRCLNYLTSPHVLIWSAVTASCAFPGLFEAQELMAKDRFGKIVPFLAPFSVDSEQDSGTSARRWRDGSLESDLPMMQLKELFNVNHFIVSQANPHIVPLLRLKELIRAYGGNFAAKLAGLAEKEVKHRCNQILELGFPLGGIAKLFSQDWEGDVTVVMPATLSQYLRIIQNPSYLELQKATNQGRRCTWEKLSAIKANCAIELVLDECVALLNHMHRLNRSVERAAASQGYTNIGGFRPSRRIPSWNCIARENSSGSLDEDSLADAGLVGGPVKRSQRAQRIVYDSSESESESLDLNSWTRNGGPLMRTASANKFINFVQNLEVEAEFKTTSSREDEIDVSVINSNPMVAEAVGGDPLHYSTKLVASDRSSENTDSESHEVSISRIMVSDGDFLQPERTHSGILLNIVKKDALIIQRNNEYEQPQGSSLEADVGTIQTEFCFDASSAFDDVNDDDDDDDERTSNVDQVIDG